MMYKYYKTENDVLSEGIGHLKTDEPSRIKTLVESEKINGGFQIRMSDTVFSYFVWDTDKVNLDLNSFPELEEIEYNELYHAYYLAFPDIEMYENKETKRRISKEEWLQSYQLTNDWTMVLVPTISDIDTEIKTSKYRPCGTNFSGAYNGITMVNGDHITGSVTCNDTYEWIIPAGATILVDGNYILTANGRITWTGTSASNWILKSNLASPLYNSFNYIDLNNVDANSNISYGQIYNVGVAFYCNGATSNTQLTISNMLIENCYSAIQGQLNNSILLTFSNILVRNCYEFLVIFNNNNSWTITISNSEIYNCTSIIRQSTAGNVIPKFALSNVYIHGQGGVGGVTSQYCVGDLDNCFIENCHGLRFATTTTNTIDNSLFKRSILYFTSSGNGTITNTDLIGLPIGYVQPIINGGGTWVNVYLAGGVYYRWTVVDTYVSGTGTVLLMGTSLTAVTSLSATRNETFVPASVTESALGDNTVTIGWTGGTGLIKSKHRIRYGTVSGTYTMVATKNWDWSNWSGLLDIMTTTPSFVLVNLKAGTLYYYVAETYDPVFDVWNASAEGDFTTTSSAPVGSSASLSDYAPETTDKIDGQVTFSNSPDWVQCQIEKSGVIIKSFPMIHAGAGVYNCKINCMGSKMSNGGKWVAGVGVVTGATVRFVARNASGIGEIISGSTLTVTAGLKSIGEMG